MMAARRLIYLVCLLGAFGFYVAYQQWAAWIILLTVVLLPWLSLGVSLPGILSFRAEITAPGAIPLGKTGEVSLRGTSRFPVPPFSGKLRLTRCITGETWVHKQGSMLLADHCGGIRAVPEQVYIFDYLGLFRFRVKQVAPAMILIRPETARVRELPQLQKYLARSWRPKPGGGYGENHELRLYRPGDALNQIHWKLSAKVGKPIIREAMEPNRGRMVITMDLMGTARELDQKFARLQGTSLFLLGENMPHRIQVLTSDGVNTWQIAREEELRRCIDTLLCRAPAQGGSIRGADPEAAWCCHIGGDSGEA